MWLVFSSSCYKLHESQSQLEVWGLSHVTCNGIAKDIMVLRREIGLSFFSINPDVAWVFLRSLQYSSLTPRHNNILFAQGNTQWFSQGKVAPNIVIIRPVWVVSLSSHVLREVPPNLYKYEKKGSSKPLYFRICCLKYYTL